MKWRSSSGSHAKKSRCTSCEYWEEESSRGSFEQLLEAPKQYIPEPIRPQDFCYCSVRRASSWWYCMFSDVNPAPWKLFFSKPIVPPRAALLHRARLMLNFMLKSSLRAPQLVQPSNYFWSYQKRGLGLVTRRKCWAWRLPWSQWCSFQINCRIRCWLRDETVDMKLALNPTTHLCAFGLRDIRPNCQKLSGQESSSLVGGIR